MEGMILTESKHNRQATLLEFYEQTIQNIPIDEIQINERIRNNLNELQVNRLSESISQIGLINPITISKNKKLVAGNHRLHACKKLGWDTIPCVITTLDDSLLLELQEIDENLIRYELHYIDRGNHLRRRRNIYEEINGTAEEIRIQKVKKNLKQFSDKAPRAASVVPDAFVQNTSKQTGISERTIKEDIQIFENITPEIREEIKKQEITKKDALKLARLKDKEKQKKVVEKVKNKEVKKVGEAIAQLKREEKLEKSRENQPEYQKKEYLPEIIHQDALEFLDSIEDRSIDLLFTDPPYMTDISMDISSFVNQWVPRALEKVKDTGLIYIFTGPYPREIKAYLDLLLDQERFYLSNILIWTYRNTIGPSPEYQYKKNWQAIFYLRGKDSSPLNTDKLTEKFSVLDFNAPDGRQANNYFKWQKPDKLAELIIRLSSQENDLLIDPFAGSGTFILKATEMKRYAKGSEIKSNVIEIAKKRGCIVKDV